MQELKAISKRLKESGQSEISLTDPDSRLMINNNKFEVCYNVQASVDDRNKLIVDYDVVNEPNDVNQLSRMGKSTRDALHADRLDVLSDTGYFNGEEIKGCLSTTDRSLKQAQHRKLTCNCTRPIFCGFL